ncbi:MAG: phosphoribosyltransferase, partial [Deltaproteobacteria bacterium]|nr:phosphoribosyltransferase [Deltaproteobacteria bacterium]
AEVVLAVPVAAADTLAALADEPGSLVAVLAPPQLRAVGDWYDDFKQVSDDEVLEALRDRAQPACGKARSSPA